ncbi:MAG: hypothetical protein LBN02_08060 [Oscillospiraceae bacterium]|jgi:hypothetical protein|nr:hypothetical protein [Oscillospiraceae bacterium]
MIPCTDNCIYQDTGTCNLDRAASLGNFIDRLNNIGDCAYAVARRDAIKYSPEARNIATSHAAADAIKRFDTAAEYNRAQQTAQRNQMS